MDDGEPGAQTVDGIALRQVKAGELAASATWIGNWQHMLPVITMCRALLSSSLKRAVLHTIREPAALSRVEYALSAEEPPLVRAAIFDLLRMGQLRAPSLHMKPLSPQTLVEPVP